MSYSKVECIYFLVFEVLMGVTLMINVFRNVIPFSLAEVHHHFRETYCLHHKSCPDDAGCKFLHNMPATQIHSITVPKTCS